MQSPHNDPVKKAKGNNGTEVGEASSAKRVAKLAMMATLALMFSYVEAVIPYSPMIPGIKLGVANLVVIIALYKFSPAEAFIVNIVRILIAGLLFSGLFGILYSIAGAAMSLIAMMLLKKTKAFSITGVSMAGGVFHNLGQILIAALIIEDARIFAYFPALIFSGIVSGIAIGILAQILINRVKV